MSHNLGSVAVPGHPGDFVFVREIVRDFAIKRLLQRMPQSLREMLSCCLDDHPTGVVLTGHYPRERVILPRAFGFVVHEIFDLSTMAEQELSADGNISANRVIFDLFARRTCGAIRWPPIFVLFGLMCFVPVNPSTVRVKSSTFFTGCGLGQLAGRAMQSAFMIYSLCKSLVCISFLLIHDAALSS